MSAKGSKKVAPRIPRAIPINNILFRVQKVEGYSRRTGNAGCILWRRRLIKVDADVTGQELLEVIVHELVHGHQFASGLMEILDRQAYEMHAEGLTQFLLSIFNLEFKPELFDRQGEL